MGVEWSSFATGVASSLAAMAVGFWLTRAVDRASFLGQFVTPRGVLLAPELARNSEKNDRFYKVFARCVTAARREVWILGEGPHDDDQLSETEQYTRYRKAIVAALKRGVRVVRIQTTREMKNLVWPRLLKDLLSAYPTNENRPGFELYFAPTNAAYSAVIDPDDPKGNITEMMLPTVSGDREIAGFGVFIRDRQWLAKAVHDKLKRLVSTAISVSELKEALAAIEKHPCSNPTAGGARAIGPMIAQAVVVRIESPEELDEHMLISRAGAGSVT